MSPDPYELLKKLRMDLSNAQAKITDLDTILRELNLTLDSRPKCSVCGLSFKNSLLRDEHVYVTHDGPEPAHWVQAEAMSEA